MLVGPSGCGKSTWASTRYRGPEIVSSDALRAIVGSGEDDLDASADAFAVLDQIVGARLRRGLTVVVDTLGLDAQRRAAYLSVGRACGMPCVAVLFETPPQVCRERNALRNRSVPAGVLRQQLAKANAVGTALDAEGWDQVLRVPYSSGAEGRTPSAQVSSPVGPPPTQAPRDGFPEVVLHVGRFPWGEDPAAWLTSIARAADDAGFAGLALMDHLIQIPQVDRAWEPIPEPWVTLGLLAGLETRLRLGTLVSPVTFRQPGVLAKAVATLDVLSGGRAFVGLGAGWWEREHLGFGVPFPPAPQRLDQLELTIETMRALWAAGTKAHQGPRATLPETTAYPRPVSQPEIIVGGNGERRTLRIAAELADACNLPSDLGVLDHKVAVLRRHCQDVGRDPGSVAVTVLDLPVIGHNREDTWRRVERLRGRSAAASFAKRHHAGEAGQHRDRYRVLAQRGVRTVFLALGDLESADDLARVAPLLVP